MDASVVTTAQMRAVEESAFARGVTAEQLMNEAGAGIARTVVDRFPKPGRCLAFAGKGHNGGDALVAAAELQRRGWRIEVRLPFGEPDCSELTRRMLERLRTAPGPDCGESGRLIVLDGLLGIGSKLPLREPIRAACREINELRQNQNAFVFAIDIPSGLDSDSGAADSDCVTADLTVTVGFTKSGLIADRALNFVGRLEVIALSELEAPVEAGDRIVATRESLRSLLPRRKFGAYKNQFGRVGIVAGSRGLTGAATLCAFGALRGGAGLVHLFVPEDIYPAIASTAPFEAMVHPIADYKTLLDQRIDVWAAGPGLGKEHAQDIRELIERAEQPMVVDADGLNIIADTLAKFDSWRGPRLLTPHPGEMERLDPNGDADRATRASKFVSRYAVTLLLKGSRTIVAERERPLSYNTTGNPAMATGGVGDVLTGVCAALIAQHLCPYDAARVGARLCGRAAELALLEGRASEQSFIARDLIEHLGAAFSDLQSAVA